MGIIANIHCNNFPLPINCLNPFQHLIINFTHLGIVRLLSTAVYVVSVLYLHCPYAVVASRSMAIVVDP